MSRHGYTDDNDDHLALGRWRAQVKSSIRGNRGQAFLRELADAMDAMPVKELILNELVTEDGCCTIGVVCLKRGIDVSTIDPEDPNQVASAVGIARQMAMEIEYENDEGGLKETDEQRWTRMRAWVQKSIRQDTDT